jgi:tetraacyldisaccharide 4'-kinase
MARLLTPLAGLYGRIAGRRLRYPRPYTSPIPVICVGNFTAGGTGKTPLTLLIARHLGAIGQRPAILTRGYGGSIRGPHLVDPATDTVAKVGDEPLLLARAAPTLVSADRVAGASFFEAMADPPTVIVMDDGLQNPSLAKMLRIAVVDARRGIGNSRVIPAGPLRAPIADQLAIADAIVVNAGPVANPAAGSGSSQVPGASPWPDAQPEIVASFRAAGFRKPILVVGVVPRTDLQGLGRSPVLAFAGIANPQRFFETLRLGGIEIAETVTYKDHHVFDAGDAEHLLHRAEALHARIVTTEKDHVRLLSYDDQRAELARSCTPIGVTLLIADDDRRVLDRLIAEAVSPAALTAEELI